MLLFWKPLGTANDRQGKAERFAGRKTKSELITLLVDKHFLTFFSKWRLLLSATCYFWTPGSYRNNYSRRRMLYSWHRKAGGGFKCFCSRTHQVRYFSRCILDAVMDKDGSLNRVFLSNQVLSFLCLTSNQQPLVQNMCDQCTKVIQVQAPRVSICLTFINIGHL